MKCQDTRKNQISTQPIQHHERCSGAGKLHTSLTGTVTSLILVTAAGCIGITGSTQNASAATSSLTLTIDNSTVELDVASLGPNGNFKKSTNTTISASTNNVTGYALSIAASNSTDYDKLINSSDSTAKLSSITGPLTEEQFKAVSATAYNNMWGYLPSKYCTGTTSDTCSANTSFLQAPTTAGDILDVTTTANTTANNYTIALGARVDNTAKLGSYTNTYVVKLVANAVPYSITYNDGVVTNMPNDITGSSADSSVNLSANVPVRDGYTFIGWCSGTVTNNNGTDTCSGTIYQPSAAYALDQTGGSNTLSLIAMWGSAAPGQCTDAATCMQTIDITTCPTTPTNMTDARDGQQYKVAKLADGKCWMVENLNLAGGTALSADDTDVTSDYISSFSGGNNLTKSGSTIVLPASSKSGFNTNNYSYVYNTGNKTNNCSDPGCYSYYSWDAATLGSGRTISTENTDAAQSICPKGWRLPTSGNSSNNGWKRGDFYALATAYGANLESNYYQNSAVFYNNAGPGTTPNFLLAGYYYDGSFYYGGSYGYYWSATSYSSTGSARGLNFGSSNVGSAGYNGRYNGFSVRCLLR